MNPLIYLAHFPKLSRGRFNKLKGGFLNLEDWQKWELTDLKRVGWEEQIIVDFLNWREQNSVDKILTAMEKNGLSALALTDPGYPPLLWQIPDAPLALFYRGTMPDWERPTVAVVGTRHSTPYGELAAREFTKALAAQSVVIVSGLALGIDGVAHKTTLDVKGTTLAVLGTCCAPDMVSPPTHKYLAEKIIAEGGAVLSEYAPDAFISKANFPMRNRIIAGLSLGTLVVEAPVQSGALITARLALDYNREVFAVPHPYNSEHGAGGNEMIKLGAHLTVSASDILETLNIARVEAEITQTALPLLTDKEKIIYNLLETESRNIDTIIQTAGLPGHEVSGLLTMLELKGVIKKMDGANYGRI